MDMKSNQYYKNEALSALRGNWANALVATIILIALALFFSSNEAINSYYQRIVINPFIGYSLSFVSLFVLLPLAVGYSNSMRVLLETGDNRLTNNSFSLGFGNWLHVVWGMILSTIHLLVDIAADYPGNHQVIFLRAYAVYSRRASGNVCQ